MGDEYKFQGLLKLVGINWGAHIVRARDFDGGVFRVEGLREFSRTVPLLIYVQTCGWDVVH
jgi:hypothetical protein